MKACKPPDKKGVLIVVEGIDGTGKSTLCKALSKSLRKKGFDPVMSFEPTNSPFGKQLRKSFSETKRLPPEEELRLFTEDRKMHVEELIRPALKDGRIVILDRYYISTMAYQGALGIDPEEIRRQNESFAPRPDVAFILELDPEQALVRIAEKRGDCPNSFETLDYLHKVKAVFDALDLPYVIRLDATLPKDEILKQAMDLILGTPGPYSSGVSGHSTG